MNARAVGRVVLVGLSILSGASLARANGVVINELDAGPLSSYVELFNSGPNAVSLDDVTVETSRGVFQWGGFPDDLQPGEYAAAFASQPEDASVSTDPSIKIMIVGEPLLGALTDTVLLKQAGSIVDAVTYGVSQDTSSRYTAAVLAGEFASGTYIDCSAQLGEMCLGRSALSEDTNDLSSDWEFTGGRDAYVGSPLEPNSAILGGEDYAVEIFQEMVNQIGINTYLRFDVSAASYANYSGVDSASSADHTFTISGPGIGNDVTMTGTASFTFTPMGRSSARTTVSGTLESGTGKSLSVSATQVISPMTSSGMSEVSAVLTVPLGVFSYSETVSLTSTGTRGAYSVAQNRSQQGNYGVQRFSSVAGTCAWEVSDGIITANDFSFDIVRDWPITDFPITQASPRPPFTTESFTLSGQSAMTGTGNAYKVDFDDYSIDYGAEYSQGNVSNAFVRYTSDPELEQAVATNHMLVEYGSLYSDIRVVATMTDELEAKEYTVSSVVYLNTMPSGYSLATVDPATAVDWGKWKKRIKSGAKVGVRWGLIGVTGAACAVGTTLTGAIAVGATAGSAGTLSGPGLVATGVVGGLCAVATTVVVEGTAPK